MDSSSSSTAVAETPLVKMSASDLFLRKQPEEVGEETSPDPALETSAEDRYYLIDKKGIVVPLYSTSTMNPNSSGPVDEDPRCRK